MEIVSKWLSTQTAFAGETPSEALYEKYKDDAEMLKIHGYQAQDDTRSFAPQLINLDEVMLANTASDKYPGCISLWFFNGDTRVVQMSYDEIQTLLVNREIYLEKSKHELLTLMLSKVG